MINIKLTDLKNMVDELMKDGIEYVEVSILESEEFDGEVLPAELHFEAFDGTGGGIDYEGIEAVEVDPFYKIMDDLD